MKSTIEIKSQEASVALFQTIRVSRMKSNTVYIPTVQHGGGSIILCGSFCSTGTESDGKMEIVQCRVILVENMCKAARNLKMGWTSCDILTKLQQNNSVQKSIVPKGKINYS